MRSVRLIVAHAAVVASLAAPALAHGQAASAGGEQNETRRVSVAWEAAPLSEVLRAFAAFSGASIVAGTGAEGFVTASIDDQPWDVALRAILASLGLYAVEEESGIIRVMSMSEVATRETIEPVVTRSYRLSFARASEIRAALAPLLSPRGSVSILEGTNTLIVSDIARVQRVVADLLQ